MAASDTSTSIVVSADLTQIQCGSTELETHSDIVYSSPTIANGSTRDLKVDILAPKTEGTKPLVIFIPGGGFRSANNDGALNLRTYVAEQGYAVASIEYRTTGNGAIYSDGVVDVKAAIRYLRAHAAEYGIDPTQVALWGESAGGYLAAMVGTTNGEQQFELGDNLDQSSDVQAVIDKFGPSNLALTQADFDAATQQAYAGADNNLAQWVNGVSSGKSLADDPAAVAAADPASYVDASDPAFLLMHGDDDRAVSPSQTLLVHSALLAAGVESTRYVIKGAGHGDFGLPAGDTSPWTSQQVTGYLVDFLNAQLVGS